MQLQVNGELREFMSLNVIADLLTELGYEAKKIAVAVNGEFVPRSQYAGLQGTVPIDSINTNYQLDLPMINETDLRRLDLNLLLTFSALMREGTTTGAAKRLFIGQSAVSMALARLRDQFGDPLFIRVGRRMEPTARAEDINRHLQPALMQIQALLRAPADFDPKAARFELRIGMTDDVELPLLRPLSLALMAEAPGVNLTVRRVPLSEVTDLLDRAEVDMSLSFYPDMPGWIGQETVATVPFRIVYDPAHNALSPHLSAQDYAALDHILVTHSGRRRGLIDEGLDKIGLKRRIIVAVPSVAHLPSLIMGTSRVAAVPAQIALHFARHHGLASIAPPMPYPPAHMSLVWHRRDEAKAEQVWARTLLLREARKVLKEDGL